MVTRGPTKPEVLAGVLYLATVVALTWLALADPYTYAYWVRFVILLPTSLVGGLFFDYYLAVLLFGPGPTTWVAGVYSTAVAIALGATQLSIAWTIRYYVKKGRTSRAVMS